MDISVKHQDTHRMYHHHHHQQQQLPSPNSNSNSSSSSCTTTTTSNGLHCHNQQPPLHSPKHITRSDSANPYPTTFVQADTSSFKQVVQMLTGSPKPTSSITTATHINPDTAVTKTLSHHNIPPIKSIPKKSHSSGFKLYERRSSLKNLKINPLNPIFATPNSGFSPRKPEILSPGILDFPALVLSPVTPLIPDPFDRSGPRNYTPSNCTSPMNNSNHLNNETNSVTNGDCILFNSDAEEKAIKEKGYYMHPSPASTPREAQPLLLPLFPMTSPRVSVGGSWLASFTVDAEPVEHVMVATVLLCCVEYS